jgi:hypothetical protein
MSKVFKVTTEEGNEFLTIGLKGLKRTRKAFSDFSKIVRVIDMDSYLEVDETYIPKVETKSTQICSL